jgi:hypothetical protein
VGFSVGLGGLCGVVLRVLMVAVRHVGMMRGFLVVAVFMMLGGFAVVMGRIVMVLGSLVMMMRSFFRHKYLSSQAGPP